MKLLRWIVVLKRDPAGFYKPVSDGRYLVGFGGCPDFAFLFPSWGAENPTLYTRKGAKFIVSELRRVGYNVRRVPFALVLLVQYIKARKKNPWKKK